MAGACRYFAKYVVARFCPLLVSFFFEIPSFRIRGISSDCMPRFKRISFSSEAVLGGRFLTSATDEQQLRVLLSWAVMRRSPSSSSAASARKAVGRALALGERGHRSAEPARRR